MSGDNVETVRRSTDAYNRRDVDGILAAWAPDAVLDWSNSRGPEAGLYRGHDQIRDFVHGFLGAWEEARIELDQPLELGDDRVVVENVTYFRGRDGIETHARSAWLITFADGLQTSLTLFQDRQEALEAARRAE